MSIFQNPSSKTVIYIKAQLRIENKPQILGGSGNLLCFVSVAMYKPLVNTLLLGQ